jgi:cytochrome c-type biogenesis protein CcmF
VLAVQAMIGVAFLAFMLFTSNPFLRLEVPPFDGQDLNPLLQDPGLAFHPPFLYLGYVGLSMAFSFAVAALIEGRVDAAWGRWVRPWTLAAWVFLTIGIALGSWWAYYELGWGGFWFWDPVENASFMPWLIAAALLHSAIVVEKREALKAWTILLAILAFGFSLIGTFIVRSGVLTSVHAFANDPERGVFILLILGIFMGGALTLLRRPRGRDGGEGRLRPGQPRKRAGGQQRPAAVSPSWSSWARSGRCGGDDLGPQAVGRPALLQHGLHALHGGAGHHPAAGRGAAVETGGSGPRDAALWGVLALALAVGALVWTMQTGRSIMGPVGAILGVWVVAGAAVTSGRAPAGARTSRPSSAA